jgi:hypothetical protein
MGVILGSFQKEMLFSNNTIMLSKGAFMILKEEPACHRHRLDDCHCCAETTAERFSSMIVMSKMTSNAMSGFPGTTSD